MPESSNLYQELKDALQEFEDFLDANAAAIKPAIGTLVNLFPELGQLLDRLIALLGELRAAIEALDPGAIPALGEVVAFTEGVRTLLTSAQTLLPARSGEIEEVLGLVAVVSDLPSLDTLKTDILGLVDSIVTRLDDLKP